MIGRAIWTIAAKDLRESSATSQVLAPVVIVPFVFVVLYPVGLLLALRYDEPGRRPGAHLEDPHLSLPREPRN